MNSTYKLLKGKPYTTPCIEKIELDNDISLSLDSTPPYGPGETAKVPDYFNNDPFKTNLA